MSPSPSRSPSGATGLAARAGPAWPRTKINAVASTVANARAGAINSRIQWVKRIACGYRNRENFRNAIYFHLGGLDLYPEAFKSAHSKARSGSNVDLRA